MSVSHDIIVIGAGIGGLVTAALLARRGVDACLFERQSYVGGCVANFEHLGHTFEPTAGLYSGWQAGGLFDQLFAELRIDRPEVHPLSPSYVVRLVDGTDIPVSTDLSEFNTRLARAFPECRDTGIGFYKTLSTIDARTSDRFRQFIEVQLQTLTQQTSDPFALRIPLKGLFAVRGGAQSIADSLAAAFKRNGGALRLNSPVLRLAYDTNGSPIGVDLLTGERVMAKRAIVSNLTIWDTYGKLFGPGRTPREIASRLKQLRGWGAYLVFASIEESMAARLGADHFLVVTDSHEPSEPNRGQFVFALAPAWDGRAPEGKRAVTISTFTDVDEWFSFHEDETAHEEHDQQMLERIWTSVHAAMPELGDSIEVLETMTPQAFYEDTRRRLGMIGRPSPSIAIESYKTHCDNVFMIGDTVSELPGVEGVCASAITLADRLVR